MHGRDYGQKTKTTTTASTLNTREQNEPQLVLQQTIALEREHILIDVERAKHLAIINVEAAEQ